MPIQPRVKGGGICVPVYKADRAGEPETFRYTAQVMPIETVNITSRISADLVKVGFKDGVFRHRNFEKNLCGKAKASRRHFL